MLFDCDGTLIASGPLYVRAWVAGFQAQGCDLAPQWYHERSGLSEDVLIDTFEQETGAQFDRNQVITVTRRTYLDELSTLSEIGAVSAIARTYHGLKPMAVVSGGPRALVLASLNALGLAYLFDAVVTIDDIPKPKPAPDLFLEAARLLGVQPHNCVVFEDSPQGLAAAKSAKAFVVDVKTHLAVAHEFRT